MNGPAQGEQTLTAEVGADAVAKLVEKYGQDAAAAVFGFIANHRDYSVGEAYEHTMEYYRGTWEDLSEYLAHAFAPKMQEASNTYAVKHQLTWPLPVDDFVGCMNWDEVANFATDHTHEAFLTHFADPEKAYFVFEIPSYK